MIELLGALLGWLAGAAFRVRRRHVEDALARVHVERPTRVAAAVYRSLGVGLVELLAHALTRRPPVIELDGESEARLDRALAGGPVVIAASHTGNWELAAAWLARRTPSAIVAKPMHDAPADRAVSALRRRLGVSTIAPRGAVRACLTRLAAGQSVALVVDQVPDRPEHGIVCDFLGVEAYVDRAPFVIAARARVPVVVAAQRRVSAGRHAMTVLGVIPAYAPAGEAARSRWVEGAASAATRWLDAFVREHPESWFWLHRRWRAPRSESALPRPAAAGYPVEA